VASLVWQKKIVPKQKISEAGPWSQAK